MKIKILIKKYVVLKLQYSLLQRLHNLKSMVVFTRLLAINQESIIYNVEPITAGCKGFFKLSYLILVIYKWGSTYVTFSLDYFDVA